MTNLYKENEEIGLTLQKCAALTFLKPGNVDLGWIHVQSHDTQCEDDKVLGVLCQPMAAELDYTVGNVELLQRSP